MRFIFLISLLFVFSACSNVATKPPAATPIAVESIPTIDPANAEMAKAQRDYNTYCAHCHGYGGEGQPVETAERTESLGYHIVPLHNSAGHTWQHPDQLIFDTTKYGVSAPTNLYTMTPFGELLTDDEIYGIIDYMRLWWTDDQQEWQSHLTEQFTENNPYWTPTRLEEIQESD